jgi:hypothetical protein
MVAMISSEQPEQPDKPQESLVHPDDKEWIGESVAAEVLKRAQDGPECWLAWEDVKAELAEMRRRGI